jgi:hypothetical protein
VKESYPEPDVWPFIAPTDKNIEPAVDGANTILGEEITLDEAEAMTGFIEEV